MYLRLGLTAVVMRHCREREWVYPTSVFWRYKYKGYRSVSLNKDFKKRCSDGEIIMSPYHVMRCVISSLPEDRKETSLSKNLGDFALAPAVGPWTPVPNAWYWNVSRDWKLNERNGGGYLFKGYPSRLAQGSVMTYSALHFLVVALHHLVS